MKKGISLIVLIITIIVLVILAGLIVFNGSNTLADTDKSKLQMDISQLEYLMNTYKTRNNGSIDFQLISLNVSGLTEEEKSQFGGEIAINGEIELYVIDLTKIDAEAINFGNLENGTDDRYVYSDTTGKVYYEKGLETRTGKYYYVESDDETLKSITLPEDWKESVVDIVDGVPIPKGFVVSPYNGENTEAKGLVIYELKMGEVSIPGYEQQYTSLTTRNQYVWVPVSHDSFVTQFVRRFDANISNTLGTNYWEVELETTNLPKATQSDTRFVSEDTLAEVQAMYESVKNYGGFYVARYETGIDVKRASNNGKLETNVYSMMGKIPYTYVVWGTSMADESNGAVEVARKIYTESNQQYGVVSTLMYGVQWDTTLQWWLDTNAVSSVTTSTTYGNYKATEIGSGDLNQGAKYALYSGGLQAYKDATGVTKNSSTMWCLTTGALKAAKVNNIYDMAGNVDERTMEGYSTNTHVYRGGGFYSHQPVYSRTMKFAPENVGADYGFRIALYIK